MNEIILKNENGQVVTSSRDVAESLIRITEMSLIPLEISRRKNSAVKNMFYLSEYTNSRGRKYNEYLMNRDGFSLLCMGFTGKEALEWKLKYIDAFNKMEEKLKTGNYLSEEENINFSYLVKIHRK